ncbi:hypothetical protein [Aequorivita echinoideorum]|uniref:Peptidylprolyl isomerase n=1 Tax=Aequorivita echinoideorum TaxID=1549647 RepID=A0ABS5S2U0_9FLAO|nr:hypothetical protein [Aequorivita echinoideorum]MBT0607511.1 hypothetical protein [Aequorivita echinoideorum]
MKNLIKVFAFSAVMFLGAQSISAQSLSQDQSRPEVIAKAETAKLTDELGLSGDQSRSVFRALVSKHVNYQKHIEGKDANDATVVANKKKFDASEEELMKKILDEKQYAKWKTME